MAAAVRIASTARRCRIPSALAAIANPAMSRNAPIARGIQTPRVVFSGGHHDGEQRHPEQVHRTCQEHQPHHGPAAAQATPSLLEFELEHGRDAIEAFRIARRDRVTAEAQAGELEVAELIEPCRAHDHARHHGGRARGNAEAGPCDAADGLERGCEQAHPEPDRQVARHQHQRRDCPRAEFAPACTLGVGERHRRRRWQHHGQRHGDPETRRERELGPQSRGIERLVEPDRPADRLYESVDAAALPHRFEGQRQPSRKRQDGDGKRSHPLRAHGPDRLDGSIPDLRNG